MREWARHVPCPSWGGEGTRRESLSERTYACGKPISTPQLAGSLTLPRCQGHCWLCPPPPHGAKLYLSEQPGMEVGREGAQHKGNLSRNQHTCLSCWRTPALLESLALGTLAQTRWQDGRRLSPGSSKDRTRRSSERPPPRGSQRAASCDGPSPPFPPSYSSHLHVPLEMLKGD